MSSFHADSGGPLPQLLDRLGSDDRMERVHAAAELVWLGRQSQEVVAAVITALKDQRVGVSKMAALVLGDLSVDPEHVVPALTEALSAADAGLRRRAAVALGQFGAKAKSAIPALQAALKDQDEGVRSFAKNALAILELTKGEIEAA